MPRRPVYIVAHRLNTPDLVFPALEAGANGVELDLRYGTRRGVEDWYVTHDAIEEDSPSFVEWCVDAGSQFVDFGERAALLLFDIKTPEHIASLRALAHDWLPEELNLLFSHARVEAAGCFAPIAPHLTPREGITIDEHDDPIRVEVELAALFPPGRATNIWYGNGISFPVPEPNVFPSIATATARRDEAGVLKKVHVWTLGTAGGMRRSLHELGADGILVNQGNIDTALGVLAELPSARLARRSDPAFRVHGA